MKKIACVLIFFWITPSWGQQAKSSSSILKFTTAELFSMQDVKSLLAAADKGKEYSKYILQNFRLVVSFEENTSEGAITSTYTEWTDGNMWSERQRILIKKYAGKQGASFTLEDVVLLEPAPIGTIWVPGTDRTVSVSGITFAIE